MFKLLSVNSVFTESRTGALNIWGTPSSSVDVVPTPSVTYASTDSQISIHTNLLGAQTEAIIQILTWSLNSFSVFFNSDPAPPPSFSEKGHDNSPASGAGKTGLLCSVLSFQLSIEVRDWKARRALEGSRTPARKPSFRKDQKHSRMEPMPQSIFTLRHN